jgi:hypothetical protein
VLCVALVWACRDEQQAAPTPPAETSAAPDRLAANERLPGTEDTFGIPVPRGMKLNYHYLDVAQAQGPAKLANLAKYYKEHVSVSSIEMSERRAVFPRAYIKGDKRKRVYRIEIISDRGESTVKISDITPAKAPEGLTEEQRWERAGLNPDGTQKNRLQVY